MSDHHMFNGVEWIPTEPPTDTQGLPYPTHFGVMDIMGNPFRCYRLNTGEAIINADDFAAFFNGESEPERKARVRAIHKEQALAAGIPWEE
jgi:hypothetical protein